MLSPLISVIIPIYNAEKFLRACIESVLVQTYANFQLLLIDDGSTDSSKSICDEYAIKDIRVESYHIPNGGVSTARNYALERARGEWFCCVDSDDEVTPTYLQSFAEAIEEGVYVYIQRHIFRTREGDTIHAYEKYGICNIDDIFEKNRLSAHGYACSKLYNLEHINMHKLRYPADVKFSEDTLFVMKVMCYDSVVKYVDKACYIYNIRANFENASSKIFDVKNELAGWRYYVGVVDLLSKIYHKDFWEFQYVVYTGSMYFARIREAMYRKKCKMTKKERITLLNSFRRKDIELYNYIQIIVYGK